MTICIQTNLRSVMKYRYISIYSPAVLCLLIAGSLSAGFAQSLGNAGTVEGTVVDPTGAAVPKARVTIHNAVTGYSQAASTDSDGSFRLNNIPPNPYHIEVSAAGFSVFVQDVDI